MIRSPKSRFHAFDLSNMRFNRLVVKNLSHIKKHAYWLCVCDCGKETIVPSYSLKNGTTQSCGCLFSDTHSTHKQTGSPTWVSWFGMRHRCKNKNLANYHLYGGSGITVCKRWKSFENFLADMGERPQDKTLDRINPNLGYEPSNCRWATMQEQNCNKKNTKFFTYKDDTLPLPLLCAKHNVDYGRVYQRITRQGWSVEKAIEHPVDSSKNSWVDGVRKHTR